MKRLYAYIVVLVVATVVVSGFVNLAIIRSVLRPDATGLEGVLRMPVAAPVARLRQTLEAHRDVRDPEALGALLGMPVVASSPDAEGLGGGERSDVSVGLDTGEALVIGARPRDALVVWLRSRDGARELRLGPFEDDGPGEAERVSLALGVVVLVAMLLSLLVTVPVARRLGRLAAAAERISAGDLTARAGPGRGVTREVTDAFDAMADRVQTLLDNQRQLLQAVSHELRTPTARIRFSLEMLEGATDEAARAKRIAAIDQDLSELDELVAELVTFARVSAEEARRAPVALVLREVTPALAEYVGERRRAASIAIAPSPGDEGAAVLADERLFHRALRNLLFNAVRYAEARVVVGWTSADDRVVLTVDDDGPGIPEADRRRVLEPFQRADESRSRDSGGLGLGLAIVRRIVELHGGEVRIEASPLGGARVVTTWPVA